MTVGFYSNKLTWRSESWALDIEQDANDADS